VKQGTRYPALLMMAADSDDRVDPMHARKFAALVQWATPALDRPALFRVEDKAGHGGGDMVKKRVASSADITAFLLDQLGGRRQGVEAKVPQPDAEGAGATPQKAAP
jgi:prolyl oligopeptidase